MNKVLIDSDIILDFYLKRQPFEDDAIELLSLCEYEVIKGYVTPVIISNVYYILRRKADHKLVITELKKLLMIVDVLVMDKDTIWASLNSKFTDFEDALQHFAATKSGEIDIILTRNLKDYKNSDLPVMTPERYLGVRKMARP